jgi:Luciferase-like monooxygenase
MAIVTTVVEAAHRALGPVGVCLPVSFASTPPADLQREAVGRLERAGYAAVWTNEVIGKDAVVQAAMLLGATEQMAFGTCIANIWARPAQTMHAAAAQLAQAHPSGREFGSPLSTMRDYPDRMGSATWPPAPDAAYPRIIAANGPKMLALAGDIADGGGR